jgi:hypothetical protein
LHDERGEETMCGADVNLDLLAQLGDANFSSAFAEGVQEREGAHHRLNRFALPT